jgi:hypothetical protein
LWELSVDELFNLGVIEKQILEIGIEQAQVHSSCPSQERQVSALGRLDDSPWDFSAMNSSLSFGASVGSRTTEGTEATGMA